MTGLNVVITLEPNAASGNLVYNTGHLLKGTVDLILNQPKKIRAFSVVIKGEANCHWTESKTRTVGTGQDQRTESYTVDFYGNEVYLNSRTYLLGHQGGEALDVNAGKTTYNFQCELPTRLPESLEASMGSIRYKVEAVLDIPWSLDKQFNTEFTVVRRDNLNDYPELQLPLKLEEVKTFCCLFCKSDPCMITASIPYGGYGVGQNIPFRIEYRNQSSIEIISTKIYVKRFIIFISSSPEYETKTESTTMVEKVIDGVKREMNKDLEDSILLPSTLSVSNGRFCNVVQVGYQLQIEACVSGCHTNPIINFPIEIGRYGVENMSFRPPQLSSHLIVPSAPPVDRNDFDIPPSFEEAMAVPSKPNIVNQPMPSNNQIGWNVNGANPSALPPSKI